MSRVDIVSKKASQVGENLGSSRYRLYRLCAFTVEPDLLLQEATYEGGTTSDLTGIASSLTAQSKHNEATVEVY